MARDELDGETTICARPPWEIYAVVAMAIGGLLADIVGQSERFRSPAARIWVCVGVVLSLGLLALLWLVLRSPTFRLRGNILYVEHWWKPGRARALDTMELRSVYLGVFPFPGLPFALLGARSLFGMPGSEMAFNDSSKCRIYRFYVGGPAMIRATFSRFGAAVAARKSARKE